MKIEKSLKIFSPLNMFIGTLMIGLFFFIMCIHNENKICMKKITYNGFEASLSGKALKVTKDGEERIYTIKEANNGIEHEEGSEYFYIRTTRNGFYYQFKFEENDGFVGDKYSNDDDFLDSFACFTFGEN